MSSSVPVSSDEARDVVGERSNAASATASRWFPRSPAEFIETKLPWLFLIYALPAVFVLSLIMPPFQVADELAHIERADQITRGFLVSPPGTGTVEGGWEVFGAPYREMWFRREVKQTVVLAHDVYLIHWSGPRDKINFQDTARYGPFCYVPQAIGVLLGRTTGISLVHTLMLARFLNGLAACAISFLALSICRRGRALMFTTLLLPMTLSQFGSASQDALIIGLSLFAVAMASLVFSEERPASTNEFALFAFIVVATTMARPTQVALAMLTPAFLRRGDRKWKSKVLIGAVAAEGVICWMIILGRLLPRLNPELQPAAQFHTLLLRPLLLPQSIVNYLTSNVFWFPMTVIGHLGWTDAPLPRWYYVVAILVLVIALVAPQNRMRAVWLCILGLSTFIALFVLQCAALFITWTPVGQVTIAGMQGRYLLPVLPLLAWAIPAYRARRERMLIWTWYPILLFPLLTLMVTPSAIMVRYYGSWSAMAASLQVFLLR